MKTEKRTTKARPEPEITLLLTNARIRWVLNNPDSSDWLKMALLTADALDPIGLQNDVEMLRHLIVAKSQAEIEIAITAMSVD